MASGKTRYINDVAEGRVAVFNLVKHIPLSLDFECDTLIIQSGDPRDWTEDKIEVLKEMMDGYRPKDIFIDMIHDIPEGFKDLEKRGFKIIRFPI
jgi:hypothetical protein